MSYLLNNQQKFNDVIFEHRNKNYGAYAIRSTYGSTLFKSLFFICLITVTIASIASYLAKQDKAASLLPPEQIKIIETTTVIKMNLEKKQTQDAQAKTTCSHPPKPIKTNAAFVSTTIKDSTETNPPLEHAPNPTAGLSPTVSGTEGDAPSLPGGDKGEAGGPASAGKGPGGILEDFDVDTPAEFEGGIAALRRFVATHLKYPELATEMGIQGTVCVRFVVDEMGQISSLTLRNNVGYGLDDEAKRVVGLIPKFKTPAKIKGVPVKVYYQLPITFKLR